MKYSLNSKLSLFVLLLFVLNLFAVPAIGQTTESNMDEISPPVDFSDRQAIITTTENFFIGDHTGSIKHKKLSMDEKCAYRYVNRNGEYTDSIVDLDSDDSDTSYKEELLSIEIYDRLALVRLRLAENSGGSHYKLLTLHKIAEDWKITTITWGSGITQ